MATTCGGEIDLQVKISASPLQMEPSAKYVAVGAKAISADAKDADASAANVTLGLLDLVEGNPGVPVEDCRKPETSCVDWRS